MKRFNRLTIILCIVILASCSGKKSETLIIIKGDKYFATGKAALKFDNNGAHPDVFFPGAIVIFKTDGNVLNQKGYAGKVYKIDKDLVLKEIVTIDTSLTDNKIIEKFLIIK
jgi:hypothetical protein